jgi:hypothetical protein
MSADRLRTAVFNTGVAVLVVATALLLGMSFTAAQVLAPLRRVVLMIVMIVVNCLLIPAAAWGLFTAFGIKAAYVSEATLAAGAAGAMGLKAAQMSRRPTGRHGRTAGIYRCDPHRLRPALAIRAEASCPIRAHPACRRAGPRGSPADAVLRESLIAA